MHHHADGDAGDGEHNARHEALAAGHQKAAEHVFLG